MYKFLGMHMHPALAAVAMFVVFVGNATIVVVRVRLVAERLHDFANDGKLK